MDLSPGPEDFRGWTPIRVNWQDRRPVIDWCFTEGVEFTDPFFDDTVRRCFRHPSRLLFRRETAISELSALTSADPALAPSGFIFHTSRCGSTLVAQMLAGLPSTLVMSEPGPLDSVLGARRIDPTLSEREHQRWFRGLVSALGRPRTPEQRHFVVKFDAWAVLDLPFILGAYPDTPWIFLYRDPVEVLVSQLDRRGYHMIPGSLSSDQLGLAGTEVTDLRPEEYCAAVLARLCESALEGSGEGRNFVNYRQLPDAVADRVAPYFGIDVDPPARAAMGEIARRNAKNPVLDFTSDSPTKQNRASSHLRQAADHWVDPHYQALEQRRRCSV
jgi:hypothetical protein